MYMKILKRNQVIITVIALMLITAGYLNSKTNKNAEIGIIEETALAELGDATLVSSTAVNVDNDAINTIEEKDVRNIRTEDAVTENITNERPSVEEYFISSRLEREKMYSQMIEVYQKILDSSTISETQKGIAQTEINKINETKNSIMIAENLLKLKNIEDIILFVNNESVNVVVKTKELTQDKVAQIQHIVSREMNANIDNIHISEKK